VLHELHAPNFCRWPVSRNQPAPPRTFVRLERPRVASADSQLTEEREGYRLAFAGWQPEAPLHMQRDSYFPQDGSSKPSQDESLMAFMQSADDQLAELFESLDPFAPAIFRWPGRAKNSHRTGWMWRAITPRNGILSYETYGLRDGDRAIPRYSDQGESATGDSSNRNGFRDGVG
jgi:hypothetical protein